MPELNAKNIQGSHEGRVSAMTRDARIEDSSQRTITRTSLLRLVPVPTEMSTVVQTPSLLEDKRNSDIPPLLRPFLSLRVQLLVSYCIILAFTVTLLFVVFNEHLNTMGTALETLAVVFVAILFSFGLISMLLRPLQQVTDAAQAIALGDLKQRERLPLRLPPQDEIDRLGGSLNEMVTRLERAEALQSSSEQSFRRFFTDASHQLRTPLTSLRGFTEVLIRGGKDDPETMQRVLKRMKSEAERMTLLINDLLMLARLDDTRLFKTQYIDLIELARERIEQSKMQAGDDRIISLVVATDKDLGIQADRERLKQLLFILLDNALKYGLPAPDGIVTLQLDRQNGHAVIRVIDNGEGIATEDKEHLFEAFYRGKYRSSTQAVMGAGLGLTIAERIVRLYRGTITVSSSPEEGTIFTVTLPSAC